jgi:hypothetical protein
MSETRVDRSEAISGKEEVTEVKALKESLEEMMYSAVRRLSSVEKKYD